MLTKIIEFIFGDKSGSGRKFLTYVAGLSFGYLVVTPKIDAKDAMYIITMVFVLYFSRNDRNPQGGSDGKVS